MNNNVKRIIDEDFDSRIAGIIPSYIIQIGWDEVSEITDEQIEKVKGNAMFSDYVMQQMVRTSRIVTKECSIQDLLIYVQTEMNPSNRAIQIDLYKEDMSEYAWEQICDQLDIERSETEINGMMIVEEE